VRALGDVLELLHGAPSSFRTLRGTVRAWQHHARSHEAFLRHYGERGGTAYAVDVASGEHTETSETISRIWVELPDRTRAESQHEQGGMRSQSTVVIDGDTWWSFDPHTGARTNGGDRRYGHGLPFNALLVAPGQVVGSGELALAGETAIAGRRGLVVHARGRPVSALFPEPGHLLEEAQLVVDAERGVLLRLEHLLDGESYALEEFTEIAFDEEFPAETFVFEPPAGEELRNARPFARERPLHEVAAAAGFTVFAATHVPPGWSLRCYRSPVDGYAAWPEMVHLHYGAADGSTQVNVSEHAAHGHASRTPDGSPWREVRVGDDIYRVWQPSDDDSPLPRQVVFERAGTQVELTSRELDAETLVDLATRFAPAPTEPPTL